jgi:hypothetical protein
MIVIFSDTTDVHADAVERVAHSKGRAVGRLNRDETHRWSLEFLCGEPILIIDGQTFAVDKIHSVFVRRLPDLQSFTPLPSTVPAEARDYIAMQRFIQTSDCIALLSERTRFINTLISAQRAQSKASQLFVADKLGILYAKDIFRCESNICTSTHQSDRASRQSGMHKADCEYIFDAR